MAALPRGHLSRATSRSPTTQQNISPLLSTPRATLTHRGSILSSCRPILSSSAGAPIIIYRCSSVFDHHSSSSNGHCRLRLQLSPQRLPTHPRSVQVRRARSLGTCAVESCDSIMGCLSCKSAQPFCATLIYLLADHSCDRHKTCYERRLRRLLLRAVIVVQCGELKGSSLSSVQSYAVLDAPEVLRCVIRVHERWSSQDTSTSAQLNAVADCGIPAQEGCDQAARHETKPQRLSWSHPTAPPSA